MQVCYLKMQKQLFDTYKMIGKYVHLNEFINTYGIKKILDTYFVFGDKIFKVVSLIVWQKLFGTV